MKINLILLSGGSGRRLWPLSNDTRSKQFLPLLKAPDGHMESMIQRVARQIRENGLADRFTVATNMAQLDILNNQLGDSVDIVTEPARRKTFPAIALSSAWLALEKQVAPDETVVVMPCDAYADKEYFEAVKRMVAAVEHQVADWVLMGVHPDHPSARYGYVMHADRPLCDGAYAVTRFVEKPSLDEAAELIDEGALWHGGVFAFRLRRMMTLLAEYIPTDSFDAVKRHFAELPEINFDYEVVERSSSVAVVPHDGAWLDLGSWRALTQELPVQCTGNVRMGEGCTDTHVVNELGIPVLCSGISGAVVACSPDGILVSSKEASEDVKSLVTDLSVRPMYEERRWGSYRVIDAVTYGDGYMSLTKSLTINAGRSISYQLHRHRDEVWTFVDGRGVLVLDGERRSVKRGDVVYIRKGQLHAVMAEEDLQFIEVQTGDLIAEDDIERFPWTW